MAFDTAINRKGTYCTQWDYVEDRFGEADLLPFTISDTDFMVPEEVLDTLKERMNHPVFGYTRWFYKRQLMMLFLKSSKTMTDF